jgi:hypothetical protein
LNLSNLRNKNTNKKIKTAAIYPLPIVSLPTKATKPKAKIKRTIVDNNQIQPEPTILSKVTTLNNKRITEINKIPTHSKKGVLFVKIQQKTGGKVPWKT